MVFKYFSIVACQYFRPTRNAGNCRAAILSHRYFWTWKISQFLKIRASEFWRTWKKFRRLKACGDSHFNFVRSYPTFSRDLFTVSSSRLFFFLPSFIVLRSPLYPRWNATLPYNMYSCPNTHASTYVSRIVFLRYLRYPANGDLERWGDSLLIVILFTNLAFVQLE